MEEEEEEPSDEDSEGSRCHIRLRKRMKRTM
jgi:hypothetical protein